MNETAGSSAQRPPAQPASAAPSPAAWRVSAWNAGNVARLDASAPDTNGALAAALAGLIAINADVEQERPATSLSVTFRASAADHAHLLVELASSLQAAIEAAGSPAGPVEINGVMRTDDGVRAWGTAGVVPGGSGAEFRTTLAGTPTLAFASGRVEISALVRRAVS